MKTAYFPMIGRLGNLLFIYAYARKWCERNEYEFSSEPWIGEKIFQIPQAVRPDQHAPDVIMPELYHQHQRDLIYSRKEVREWLQWRPEIRERLSELDKTATPLVLSRREAEFDDPALVQISEQSYREAAAKSGLDINTARWMTNLSPETLSGFDGDKMASGLGVTLQPCPSFYRLMTAPVLFRAPSTFDWWAATLGSGKVFSPVVRGLPTNTPDVHCPCWVEGNWPVMCWKDEKNSDLYLRDGHTLNEMYQIKSNEPSDINEHLKTLAQYSIHCEHVTEFGVRSIVSTWGLLQGRPRTMVSYDQTHPGLEAINNVIAVAAAEGISFSFGCANVLGIGIEPTDLLFIDTYHTYPQLSAELDKHAGQVRKWIICHDTEQFGRHGERADDPKGLMTAIEDHIRRHPEWRIKEHFTNNNGLTVLERT